MTDDDALNWSGGESSLNQNDYSLDLRKLVAEMLSPNANSRPSAQNIYDEALMYGRIRRDIRSCQCPYMCKGADGWCTPHQF